MNSLATFITSGTELVGEAPNAKKLVAGDGTTLATVGATISVTTGAGDGLTNKTYGAGRMPTAATAGATATYAGGAATLGGTNLAGGALILAGGIGTGTGVGGAVTIKVAKHGNTGTTDNALINALNADEVGNVTLGPGALDHTSTNGFFQIPIVATAPDSTPTQTAGWLNMCFCSADSKLYINTRGSTWIKSGALG